MEQKLAQLQAKIEVDQRLAEKLFALETSEEVQIFLKTEGLDFTLEEINVLREALLKSLEKGELSDEDLEEVAGGFVITFALVSAIGSIIGATVSAGGLTHNVTRGRW